MIAAGEELVARRRTGIGAVEDERRPPLSYGGDVGRVNRGWVEGRDFGWAGGRDSRL